MQNYPSVLHIQKVANIAGSENHLLTLLPRLKESGYEPTMLVLTDRHDHPSSFLNEMQSLGIQTEVMPILGDLNPRLISRLVNFIQQKNYAIVHTHLLHADLYGALAARLAQVQWVISTHHNDDKFRRHIPWRWAIAWNMKLMDRVICISENVKQFSQKIEQISSNKITVIPYGLNPDSVKQDRSWLEKFGWSNDVPVLGIVARLTEQKGHTTLLKAMSEVVRQFPTVQLVIIGDGELRQELQELVNQLSIAQQVYFLGYRENAAGMMAGFDIFVHPSRWEGFGLVFLEAMTASLPIVATQVGSIPEIVRQGETGLLVPVDDPTALAHAICRLLSDRTLARKMGRTGRDRLEKNFTVAAMVERTCRLYKHLALHNDGMMRAANC
ncbi:MAG: glycosyltransferase family 4 protein [Hormoscilla sp.]